MSTSQCSCVLVKYHLGSKIKEKMKMIEITSFKSRLQDLSGDFSFKCIM